MHFSPEELEILSRTKPSAAHRWLAQSGQVGVFAVIDHGATPSIGEVRIGPSTDRTQTLELACRLARSASIRAGLLGLPNGGMATVAVAHPQFDRTVHEALLRGRLGETSIRAIAGPGLEGSASQLGDLVLDDDEGLATLRGDVLEACLEPLLSMKTCSAAVLDCGPSGRAAATRLRASGSRVCVWDPDPPRAVTLAESLDVEVLEGPWIEADVDLLVPCGPEPVLDDSNAPQLAARNVCGLSPRVFATPSAREALESRERRFVPELLASTAPLIAIAVAEGWLERDSAVSLINQTATEVLVQPRGAQGRATTLAIERSNAASKG